MKNQKGNIAILTAILLTVFLGFVAISVDVGFLFASKNQLQNSADAGALAGASELFLSSDGTAINEDCNEIAKKIAERNQATEISVEVKRGHWSFSNGFNANDSLTQISDLWDFTKDELDGEENFINAVWVKVSRDESTFFAQIFGKSNVPVSATAVAYIGFAGVFHPGEFDAPIALCEEYLGPPPPYTCGVAVWYEQAETAMWTNLDQIEDSTDDSCNSADANEVKDLVSTGNTETLYTGSTMGVTNGMVSAAHSIMHTDWEDRSTVSADPTARKIVEFTLPVIRCEDEYGNVNTCAPLVGGVRVEVLWMNDNTAIQKAYDEVPNKLYDTEGNLLFESSTTSGEARWNEFAEALDLVNNDGTPLSLEKHQLYFRASCEHFEPTGGPGGPNLGVLSKIPVLVD